MFAILVEMWSQVAEDEFDLEYCGEFLWSDGFSVGQVILFDQAIEALNFMYENKMEDKVPGFEYRYRIQQIDNFDEGVDNMD